MRVAVDLQAEVAGLGVTPKEAMKMCFDIDPSQYFSCSFDAEKKLQELDSSMASSGEPTISSVADNGGG